jgi:hypothetical protein
MTAPGCPNNDPSGAGSYVKEQRESACVRYSRVDSHINLDVQMVTEAHQRIED